MFCVSLLLQFSSFWFFPFVPRAKSIEIGITNIAVIVSQPDQYNLKNRKYYTAAKKVLLESTGMLANGNNKNAPSINN